MTVSYKLMEINFKRSGENLILMKFEFDSKKYLKDLKNSSSYFHTFINHESLAGGVLQLQPGDEDTQTPHDVDELYYIIRGDGFLKINNKDYSVDEGKVFFVPKDVEHHFFGNKKELVVMYFFGGSNS